MTRAVAPGWPPRVAGQGGQAAVLLVGILCAVLFGAAVLGLLAGGISAHGRQQRAADLGALSAAKTMHDLYPRLFEPVVVDGVPNPRHLSRVAYLAAATKAGAQTARANGAEAVAVSFPDADPIAPALVRVDVGERITVTVASSKRPIDVQASADATLVPVAATPTAAWGDEYDGPLELRQGKPMRPDVARAFDRMAAAAAADGVQLMIVSGFRTNAEQAVLFAQHPDPKWVAPPGQSLHRLATELDLGPGSAYGWLAANAQRFHFVQRYSWEPWHYGYVLNPASSRAMARRRDVGADGEAGSSLPSFVPERYAPAITRAAQRYNVSATLLAAQIEQESGFNPFAVSPAGARGIAQFMPGTASSYGLHDAFDAEASIDAQARLMRDLLRQFGSVPLALAAYNAGPQRVAACGCVPPIPETTAYVAAILGLMGGAGDVSGFGGLEIRLVR
ncbi:MAG: transglycosylase SLT domain-containing protein [Solirubrobacteraceae bacterium]